MRVAYQGIPGSFSHLAVLQIFGKHAKCVGASQFREIFQWVKQGKATRGVIPIENTLAGSIYENYDLLTEYRLAVIGEYNMHVAHHLLAFPMPGIVRNDRLRLIRKVYSHPKALEQCRKFFRTHQWMEGVTHADTARAAKLVADQRDPTIAAIAGDQAAQLYGLNALVSHIEDNRRNVTRFLIIAKKQGPLPRTHKCSVVFTLPHTPGSLHRALGFVADHDFNLTKIESRPIEGKPFEYLFYVDFEFNDISAQILKKVLDDELGKLTKTLYIFGTYRASRVPL